MSGNKKTLVAKPTFNTAIIPVVVTILSLLPFVGKAFHIDDPLFIWSAKQISNNPADFYGFDVNWYGTEEPMSGVLKNPPLACYYMALVGSLFGWSEIVLHTAFLLPAAVAAAGTYCLARQFCSRPTLAALAALLTPAFLISSTNIMCDTMMLASWVWAVFLWVRGTRNNHWLSLLAAAVLIATCALTKYFGMALLPLLFVYSLIQKRKLGVWVFFLLIPVAILAGYQWLTYALYGRGLLSDAAVYATEHRYAAFFSKGLIGLAFIGGCIVTTLFYTPLLWSRRVLLSGIVLTILFIFALTFAEKIGRFPTHDTEGIKWGLLAQLGLTAAAGVSLLGIAGVDSWKSRNADSLLLLFWVLGTFIFAGFINWTVNARSVLPIVPAAGILLMRRIDQRSKAGQSIKLWRAACPLIPAALVALLFCRVDYAWANSARNAAEVIRQKFENQSNRVWFQGHWGFQYYMEAENGRALDFKHSKLMPGDIIIVPSNNTNIKPLSKKMVYLNHIFQFTPSRWLATMDIFLGAGFYTDAWGPLPFAVGSAAPEKYYAFIVK